jgi:hypothetical protein
MKQTAVEWLIEQLNKKGFAPVVTDEEIEQAKEMEKEQNQRLIDWTLNAYGFINNLKTNKHE